MSLLLLSLLTGCWKPQETGPTSMVGHVYDQDGAPMPGITIDTIESHAVTDEAGRFAVNYKEPSQKLTFEHDGVLFRRDYLETDDGTEVRLDVPTLQPHTIACDFSYDCAATFHYELAPGYRARTSMICSRGEPFKLKLPEGDPTEITCREGNTGPELPARLDTRNGWRVTPPTVVLGIELSVHDAEPTSCTVEADGKALEPVEPGRYEVLTFGTTRITGGCDDIPFGPRRIYVSERFTLDLSWTPNTPTLDISRFGIPPIRPRLVKSEGTGAGWAIDLPLDSSGVATLPPLEKGRYTLGMWLSDPDLMTKGIADGEAPDTLHWHPDARTGWGAIEVTTPLREGAVPVQMHP